MIAVVIPAYRVKSKILGVIAKIGPEIRKIYIIDDCCPEQTGKYVGEILGERVKIITHSENQGVGGATISGYREALRDGAEVIVKLDGDGQMNPALIPLLIKPILDGNADYTKGNRFFDLAYLNSMPKIRIFGNAILSFVNKATSGYWDIMDPTNGFTAVHNKVLQKINLEKIEKRFFFESDMLFRLNIIRAVVSDVPMMAAYGDEISNLRLHRIIFEFPAKYMARFFKRIFYNYFLRDFNAGSMQMVLGLIVFSFGAIYGMINWFIVLSEHAAAASGVVMMAALPILIGSQLLINAANYDIGNTPKKCLHKML